MEEAPFDSHSWPNKLSAYLLAEWTHTLSTITRFHNRRLLASLCANNLSLKRFLEEQNLLELKPEALEALLKKIPNASVLFGFKQFFQRIEAEKLKHFTKELDMIFE